MFEDKESDYYKSTMGKDGAHYNIFSVLDSNGMAALRQLFPDGKADSLNFCLFSTSGVHGLYNTIEESEKVFNGEDKEGVLSITFLIIHPRLVCLRYGNCIPETEDDYGFLKLLRATSQSEMMKIGFA